jgi:hypothetical protein
MVRNALGADKSTFSICFIATSSLPRFDFIASKEAQIPSHSSSFVAREWLLSIRLLQIFINNSDAFYSHCVCAGRFQV